MSDTPAARDHGGGVDAAAARHGGDRDGWLDLSTGINPRPYGVTGFAPTDWTALPDIRAQTRLDRAARTFWRIPDTAAVLAAPGASSLIARMPARAQLSSASPPGAPDTPIAPSTEPPLSMT